MKKILKFLRGLFVGSVSVTHKQHSESNIPKPDDKQLQEKWPVPETPFMIVKLEGSFFVTFREYRLTDPVMSIVEAWTQANHPDWQLHINLINAIILTHENMKKELIETDVKASNKKFMANLKHSN